MSEPIIDLTEAVAALGALTPHAASVRLAQYGERGKPYDCGNEKALYEIAVALDAETTRLRAELAAARQTLRVRDHQLARLRGEMTGGPR